MNMLQPILNRFFILFFIFSVLQPGTHFAQKHKKNIDQRINIDAKAEVNNPTGKEGLLRSREFIRIDSTYYKGFMWEGLYRAFHAADYFGYNLAIPPLVKAKELLEKDYSEKLTTKETDGFVAYLTLYFVQEDYQKICNELWDCYMNTQQFQKAYDVTTDYLPYDLQFEYFFNGYISRSWIVHKLRLQKKNEYSFLNDDYLQNVKLAIDLTDSSLIRLYKKKNYYDFWFETIIESNEMSVAHYKALLYSYLLQIDSADKYYDKLKESAFYSHNNRGNYLNVKGEFEEAEAEYLIEKEMTQGDDRKRLREYEYFLSILNIYKSLPYKASTDISNLIKNVGSTPGYGWYNIALARTYAYEGQLEKAQKTINKAHNFKELHIGTSLGQQHYDFARNTVQYLIYKRKAAWYKKKNKSYWYNPIHWWNVAVNAWNTYSSLQIVLTQLSDNKERQQVIYKIFSSETVISWDELYELIDELPNKYFIRYFEKEIANNKDRLLINKYYHLFLAKLYYEDGNYNQANKNLLKIGTNANEIGNFDQLFLFRTLELYQGIYNDEGNNNMAEKLKMQAYNYYPQLMAFNSVTLPIHIQWQGERNKEIEAKLKDVNISLQKQEGNYPTVKIILQKENDRYHCIVSLYHNESKQETNFQRFVDKDINVIANAVVKSVFQIGNKDR